MYDIQWATAAGWKNAEFAFAARAEAEAKIAELNTQNADWLFQVVEIEGDPVFVGRDSNIIIETEVQPDAVTAKQIALIEQELMIVPVARTNRRAVVKSIAIGGVVRVSIQAWQRIIPRADENSIGDTYRWVELRSVRF